MMALKKNETWDLTPLSKEKKLVGCRWVYAQKFHATGKLERCKTRLVAKGYTQREGIDYVETFVPVAKFNTVRILIALASKKDWTVLNFDVKNTFLHGELEEVYMTPPLGYQLTPDKTLVCQLKKTLYGLKQSPRAWLAKLARAMKEMNYYQSNGDHILFMKHGSTGKVVILIVYFDNILVTSDDVLEIKKLSVQLLQKFDIKTLRHLKYFLGIEVARFLESIFLSQWKYVIDLLREVGMTACKPANSHVDVNVKLNKG